MHSRTGMREQRIHYKQLEPKKFKVCFCYPKRFLIKNYIPKGTIIFFLKKETNTLERFVVIIKCKQAEQNINGRFMKIIKNRKNNLEAIYYSHVPDITNPSN